MIKLLVLAVLAVVFGLTIWLSPRFFRSDAPAAPRAAATGPTPAGAPPAEAPAGPSRTR
jgi:predicted lipid-binding transport protein (Tim44 family)